MTSTPPPQSPERAQSPEGPESSSDAPQPEARARLTCSDAEQLGTRIQQQAALIAEATCELLLMVGEFDAREGFAWFDGLKSTAHWLGWSCFMSPGTAREHVRVARALPRMPLTVAEFRVGRLSYSKVREMTRLVDRVDEAALVELARSMTASQLAQAISTFRAVDGTRLGQDAVRQARWQVREDGMVEIHAVLPADMGAELITALELALGRDGTEPPQSESVVDRPARDAAPHPNSTRSNSAPTATRVEQLSDAQAAELAADVTTAPTLEQRRADAFLDLARTFLDAEPDDRSGEDRHLVIIQVSAESLSQNVPAGTPSSASPLTALPHADEQQATESLRGREPTITSGAPPHNVPAGTSERCGVLGMGPLEIRTAERLACTGKVAITITDAGGEILHLGRSRRLASRAQRRALRMRDTTCSFPGCHQSQHLDAHHVVPWSEGGLTDIEGLALLCRRHHVMVHEGGLRLVPGSGFRTATSLSRRLAVVDADGRPVQARWPAMFEHLLFRSTIDTKDDGARDTTCSAPPPAADPERIAATTGGEGFRLADCVDVLCSSIVELAA
ncbi:HNH endonuclease signature motif containing protein [uncultured Brachybacterium sp.]|uniref:HNH endonuclease signature motif containing protein n=1 Tax=uncultured Brachybacterium sp. TaxID=189680 RepID=UPI00261B3220|nr:HNH endonuclease signature motif containing protein [uncultured Brachybacterium sp.]